MYIIKTLAVLTLKIAMHLVINDYAHSPNLLICLCYNSKSFQLEQLCYNLYHCSKTENAEKLLHKHMTV